VSVVIVTGGIALGGTYDAVTACEADTAQLAVPKKPTPLLIELVYEDAVIFPITVSVLPLNVRFGSPFSVLVVPVAVTK
jgi:hypothetical protein